MIYYWWGGKIARTYNIQWKNSFLQWDLPTNITADVALSLALPIAHQTKRNPVEVAQEIVKTDIFVSWEWTITKSGYINIRLPSIYYQEFLVKTYQTQGNNLKGEKKNIGINLEYVSTNPTGYLHLAHFRHAFVGNTLANVYQFLGYEVIREYYINDRGRQITALINSVYYFYHQLQEVNLPVLEKVEYPGKSSREAAQKIIEKWEKKYLQKELTDLDFKIWKKEILELILTRIQQDLAQCGVKFDVWFSETSLYEKNQHLELLEKLKKLNLIYFQDGATFFRSSLAGDEKDRVIIKQNGDYTYFFSDILYHHNKLERTDRAIYILGADHHGFLARLKSVHQLLGYLPETIQIVLVQIVNLLTKAGQTERFSKRAGNTIELEEALEYMDLNQLKFFLLEKEPNQPLALDAELLKKDKEKTRLYYLQYAHARCHSIFQKAEKRGINQIANQIDLLGESERKIFNWLIRFLLVLEKIIEENKPHYLVHYLYELAQTWQVYYQNNIILEEKNPELTAQKLLLVKNIQIILKLGLNLMGIEAPENM